MPYAYVKLSLVVCILQDRVEEVQAALEELAVEKERLLRHNADLQAELQARAARVPLPGPACRACGPVKSSAAARPALSGQS